MPSVAHATGTGSTTLTVSATGPVLNQSWNVMVASLTDQYGHPIRHAQVTITPLDDAWNPNPVGSCTATTDASGRASCAVHIWLVNETSFSGVDGSFAGNDELAPATSYTPITFVYGWAHADRTSGWAPVVDPGVRNERSGSGNVSSASGDPLQGQEQLTLTPGEASADASETTYSTQLGGLTLRVVGAEAHSRASCVVSGGFGVEHVVQSFKVSEITLTGLGVPGGSLTINPVPAQPNQTYSVPNYTNLGGLTIVVGETYDHEVTAVHVTGPMTSIWIASAGALLEHCEPEQH
ncbi:MAG TPA: hypothetical protein VJ872_11890 [Nocardioides sp.]|nr:hypothetical protein [Nocardioides sp.]